LAKLRQLSGRQIRDILRRHGFVEVHQRGSHLKMRRTVGGKVTVVSIPQHRTVKPGTLRSILRHTGIPRSEFE